MCFYFQKFPIISTACFCLFSSSLREKLLYMYITKFNQVKTLYKRTSALIQTQNFYLFFIHYKNKAQYTKSIDITYIYTNSYVRLIYWNANKSGKRYSHTVATVGRTPTWNDTHRIYYKMKRQIHTLCSFPLAAAAVVVTAAATHSVRSRRHHRHSPAHSSIYPFDRLNH